MKTVHDVYVRPADKVKACPFCGTKNDPDRGILSNVIVWVYSIGGERGRAFAVRCTSCRSEGPTSLTEEEAMRSWNGRHEPTEG
jgi:hypothetical protein